MGLPARKTADELVAELKALAALGFTHIVLESRLRDLEEMTALYERLAREARGLV